MKVWVAMKGEYENRGIAGIFASPELAMGHFGGKGWTRTLWCVHPNWPSLRGRYYREEYSHRGTTFDAHEVIDSGPVRVVDKVMEQRLQPKPWHPVRGPGWDYVPITDEEGDRLLVRKQVAGHP